MFSAFLTGMGVGASLIIAIGAQNAFVISQGLRRHYPIMVALTCAICDAILILIGIAGVGGIISSQPELVQWIAWGGAAFLFWYGAICFRRLFKANTLKEGEQKIGSRKDIFLITLAITLLNPHVYLDTVILVGGIGVQFEEEVRSYFAAGAVCASFLWFFTISLGASWASPYLARPVTWKIIDGLSGVVMWTVAVMLLVK